VFPANDHRSGHKFFTVENRKRVLQALETVKPIADKLGASFAQLAIRWAIDQPGITGAIVGARNAAQAAHNVGALNIKLDAGDSQRLRDVFAACAKAMTS
jgi:aryl-alcohol dehydrogenase-like predicted oxidoreductase